MGRQRAFDGRGSVSCFGEDDIERLTDEFDRAD